ncbi:hypothetical protein [Streptomyces sp. NPDC050560]|uniref:hypothetical protein n=1 Tax=Streptomyces sp. NPDC050560 TaxID=3365630 RepID=UPI0037B02513
MRWAVAVRLLAGATDTALLAAARTAGPGPVLAARLLTRHGAYGVLAHASAPCAPHRAPREREAQGPHRAADEHLAVLVGRPVRPVRPVRPLRPDTATAAGERAAQPEAPWEPWAEVLREPRAEAMWVACADVLVDTVLRPYGAASRTAVRLLSRNPGALLAAAPLATGGWAVAHRRGVHVIPSGPRHALLPSCLHGWAVAGHDVRGVRKVVVPRG